MTHEVYIRPFNAQTAIDITGSGLTRDWIDSTIEKISKRNTDIVDAAIRRSLEEKVVKEKFLYFFTIEVPALVLSLKPEDPEIRRSRIINVLSFSKKGCWALRYYQQVESFLEDELEKINEEFSEEYLLTLRMIDILEGIRGLLPPPSEKPGIPSKFKMKGGILHTLLPVSDASILLQIVEEYA